MESLTWDCAALNEFESVQLQIKIFPVFTIWSLVQCSQTTRWSKTCLVLADCLFYYGLAGPPGSIVRQKFFSFSFSFYKVYIWAWKYFFPEGPQKFISGAYPQFSPLFFLLCIPSVLAIIPPFVYTLSSRYYSSFCAYPQFSPLFFLLAQKN